MFWAANKGVPLSSECISSRIGKLLDEVHGGGVPGAGGDFVWYENPKMSVHDDRIFHVQTFWRPPHLLTPTDSPRTVANSGNSGAPDFSRSVSRERSHAPESHSMTFHRPACEGGHLMAAELGCAFAGTQSSPPQHAIAQMHAQQGRPTEIVPHQRPRWPRYSSRAECERQTHSSSQSRDSFHERADVGAGVRQLIEMGFDAAEAQAALVQAGYNVHSAALMLVSGI